MLEWAWNLHLWGELVPRAGLYLGFIEVVLKPEYITASAVMEYTWADLDPESARKYLEPGSTGT